MDPSVMMHLIVKSSEYGVTPCYGIAQEDIAVCAPILFDPETLEITNYTLRRVDRFSFHMGFARHAIANGQQGLVDIYFDYEED